MRLRYDCHVTVTIIVARFIPDSLLCTNKEQGTGGDPGNEEATLTIMQATQNGSI